MEKQIWTMVDIVQVAKKVDFGEAVTLDKAIEMWLEEEYLDIVDENEISVLEFVKGY